MFSDERINRVCARAYRTGILLAVLYTALYGVYHAVTVGGVFPEELLKNFVKAKRAECAELAKIPHPAEFDKYYNL